MTDADVAFADYGDILRRRWRLVALGVLVGLVGALGALYALPKTFTSTASVMVLPTGEDGAVQGGRTSSPVNLDTEAQIVQSTVVSQLALESMDDPIETSTRELAKHVTVTVPPNTSVLNISFDAPTRESARDGARTYAQAYLENREAIAERRIESQAETAQSQIDVLEAQIRDLDKQLRNLPEDSPERVGPNVRRELLAREIATLSSTLVGLRSSGVTPGEVITEAQLPLTPSSPNAPILLASGILGGLLLGLLSGYVIDRLDRRVRDRRTLENLGVDTLASGFTLTPALGSLSPHSAEAMRQVRNGLLVQMPEDRPSVLVASSSDGVAGSLVALHLSETIALSGLRVLLVSANSSRCIVSESFEMGARRGLSDLIRGRARIEESIYDVPGKPNLSVLRAGPLHSELLVGEVRRVLEALSARADVLVIDVAPTSRNADAQSFASFTSGVLLVAEAMHTDRDEVSDAIDQFRHVSAKALGGVVVTVDLNRHGTRRTDREERKRIPFGGRRAARGRDVQAANSSRSAPPSMGTNEGTSPSSAARFVRPARQNR